MKGVILLAVSCCAGLAAFLTGVLTHQEGSYHWLQWDSFDDILVKFSELNDSPQRCQTMAREDQFMPMDTVSQIPKYNRLRTEAWYKNRSSLIHLHNMALNRAYFYSFISQKLNSSEDFKYNPDWYYYYMSATADIHASDNFINGSAIFFDTNSSYANWFKTLPFNTTLPLFGPKAWKSDNWRDGANWLREPTLTTTTVKDYGAFGLRGNYTHPGYKMNPWYQLWLPDVTAEADSLNKFTYSVGLKYSNVTGHFIHKEFQATAWFGPASPGQLDTDRALPVLFTRPYFDCGHADKWTISATSPIVDYMPRYTNWTHRRRARFVAVVVMDIDFERIDFNSCPVSVGNPGPSLLSGVDRCKKTTMCKHTSGFGFKRGGYKCVCRPGYRFPHWIKGPYQGVNIEQATEDEYENGFTCRHVDWRTVLPSVENVNYNRVMISRHKRDTKTSDVHNITSLDVEKYHRNNGKGCDSCYPITMLHPPISQATKSFSSHQEFKSRKGGHSHRNKRTASFDQIAVNTMERIFYQHLATTADNCHLRKKGELLMQGDVAYGVDEQFEPEARTALRLSHFLSNYLQNVDPGETYGDYREAKRLHVDHLFGEVLANVMANHKIQSSGVYFDAYAFENMDGNAREFFGPYAWRTHTGEYKALDSAGLKSLYITENWFQEMKQRWRTNTGGMKNYEMKSFIRLDTAGSANFKFDFFPVFFRAPSLTHGRWTRPYFKCDRRVDDWVMTYVVPFIGKDQLRRKLQFKGVVTVDVLLSDLDINQCPQPFHTPNVFKNTARCPYPSTSCSPISGYKFQKGAYMCSCNQGFEYAHLDGRFWIEGGLLEREYEKKSQELFSRFDDIKCRISGGTAISMSMNWLPLLLSMTLFLGVAVSAISDI